VPLDYLADAGATFTTARGYGWNTSVQAQARNANSDQRLDTYAYVSNSSSATWEYALPNGDYFVTVVGGSPLFSAITTVKIEGTTVIDAVATTGSFVTVEDHLTTVVDGKLTVEIGGSNDSKKSKIEYLIIKNADH
jgi:hypothetical protein